MVTGIGLLRHGGLRQAVSSGVAVSVAAVPEGLPLVADAGPTGLGAPTHPRRRTGAHTSFG